MPSKGSFQRVNNPAPNFPIKWFYFSGFSRSEHWPSFSLYRTWSWLPFFCCTLFIRSYNFIRTVCQILFTKYCWDLSLRYWFFHLYPSFLRQTLSHFSCNTNCFHWPYSISLVWYKFRSRILRAAIAQWLIINNCLWNTQNLWRWLPSCLPMRQQSFKYWISAARYGPSAYSDCPLYWSFLYSKEDFKAHSELNNIWPTTVFFSHWAIPYYFWSNRNRQLHPSNWPVQLPVYV